MQGPVEDVRVRLGADVTGCMDHMVQQIDDSASREQCVDLLLCRRGRDHDDPSAPPHLLHELSYCRKRSNVWQISIDEDLVPNFRDAMPFGVVSIDAECVRKYLVSAKSDQGTHRLERRRTVPR